MYSQTYNFNELPQKYTVNTLTNFKKYFCSLFPGTFTKKEDKHWTKQIIKDKTLHVQNKILLQSEHTFTPVLKMLHHR